MFGKAFYQIHLEITGYPCNVIGSQRCDLFTDRAIFCFNRSFFADNENGTLKLTNHIAGK